ncbi:MAG: DUF3108 domain-containing protein [Opitutaceae bacterium]|nr:DUF3108 domain-containing protein [Opitutaceae bacterium]
MRAALAALAACVLLCAPPGRAADSSPGAPSLPLQHGEKLVYRVSWAVVPGAGEIKIEAHRDPAAPDERLIVTSTTATRRLARMLLPFDATSDSIFDLRTGQLLSLHEKNNHRGKNNAHNVTFDYTKREATYSLPGAAARTLPIPGGDPVDLIMGLIETRSWNLKAGGKRDALILFDDDFYELTIHFARHEDVRTPMGTFKTVVLEPRMDKTAPKGMFKRGSKVRVWIAQDAHRLPVKFEVEFKIGTGTATLESYTPPSPAQAAAGRPAPAR